jgi:hypothetical protein
VAAAQDVEIPADTSIRLQRTACFGPCPEYSVTIDARGLVTYVGEKSVRVVGRRTARIDPSVVATLLARAERIRFFDLRNEYRFLKNPDGTTTMVSDLPTKIVTITVSGRSKRVEDYLAAPDDLAQFEREIDEAAGTKRWVFIDEEALEELVGSGWLASGEMPAAEYARRARQDAANYRRTVLDRGRPTVEDFDRVIALLESATRK